MGTDVDARRKSLALAALCVGGMTLANTVADPRLANEIRNAALDNALALLPEPGDRTGSMVAAK